LSELGATVGATNFGRYGDSKTLLVTGADFQMKGRYEFDCSLGIEGLPDGRFVPASRRCAKDIECTDSVQLAVSDEKSGPRYLAAGVIEK
jgi:hypothetical protein